MKDNGDRYRATQVICVRNFEEKAQTKLFASRRSIRR